MSKLLKFVLPLAFVGPALLPAQEITNTIVHDTFSAASASAGLSADANGYLAPTSTQAFWLGGGTTPTYTQNTSIKASAGNRGLLAYFEPSTTLASVEVGETLTVKTTFKYTGGTGAASVGDFRMGVLNSGGNGGKLNVLGAVSRVALDNFSLTAGGDTPRGYSGYLVDSTFAATAPASNSLAFWRREGGLPPEGGGVRSQQWLGPTSSDLAPVSAFIPIGSAGGGAVGAVVNNGTVYVATFSITPLSATVKDGDGVVTRQATTKLTFTVTSGGSTVMTYSATEAADAAHVGFDTFIILSTYNAGLEITDFLVTKTSIALAVTSQPASQTVAAGTDVTLSVVAVGAPAPTYQWQKDGANIAGADATSLTLTNVQASDAGGYRVVLTNSNGTVTSETATLTVATTPIITSQPTGSTIFEGVNASLSVGAIGAAPLTYQWKKDDVAVVDDDHVSGSGSATLTFTHARISDTGVYTVTIGNGSGSVTTDPATFTVYPSTPPSFVSQPASQTVIEGATVTFPVTIDGPPPFTYQWRKDGVDLVDDGVRISGSTTATLTLTAVSVDEAGAYSLVVHNPASSATSADAVLTVNAAPTPLPPVAIAPRNVIETSFTARWASATNAVGYRLDVSSDPTFATFLTGFQDLDAGPNLSRSVPGLNINTTYYYRVRAYNSTGTSGNSNVMTVVAQSPVAPAIVSLSITTFTAGVPGAFTLVGTGAPLPSFTASGLPTWATLDSSTGVLSGTPPVSAAGTSVLVAITAQNDTPPDATQTLTINIVAIPAVAEPLSVTTLAGAAGSAGTTDGTGTAARFNTPSGVAVDASGNIYIADAGTHLIRKVSAAGAVTTFAGKAGTAGHADGTGTAATFDTPSGLAVDAAGNVYVADTLNHTIRKITSAGVVSTFAGTAGASGSADGTGAAARFFAPQGLALASAGTDLFVADTNNHTIRKLALSTAAVTTFAGKAGESGNLNGVGSAARFNAPSDLAIDKNGNLYVADTDNSTIRVLSANGSVATLAGLAGSAGAADGLGAGARFNHPSALGVDSAFNVYVLDTDNHTIRKLVSAAGAVTTIAGQAATSGSADGIGSDARFKFPAGIAVSSGGELYIADTNNHTLRVGQLPNVPTITVQPQSQSVTVGSPVQFSVKASGRPAVTYQWFLNGGPVTGGTSDTLSISNAQAVNAGDYTVVVSNAVGSVTSNRAGLVINPVATPPVGISGGGSSGGGGGAPSAWFYLALALLVAARWAVASRRSARRPVSLQTLN